MVKSDDIVFEALVREEFKGTRHERLWAIVM